MNVETNVVPLKIVEQGGKRRVHLRRPPYDECQHRSIELDEKHRTIECKRCHATVDPFYWLTLLARDDAHVDHRLEAIKAFEEKERKREADKRAACVAAGHPIGRRRGMCRCRSVTRWQKEHPPDRSAPGEGT